MLLKDLSGAEVDISRFLSVFETRYDFMIQPLKILVIYEVFTRLSVNHKSKAIERDHYLASHRLASSPDTLKELVQYAS